MKRSLPLILALLGAALPVIGEGELVLRNPEPMTLYYVLDPPELQGLDATSPGLRLRLADYFLKNSADFPFTPVLPGRSGAVESVSAGRHLLLGFFAPEGTLSFPIVLREIRLEEGQNSIEVSVYREPSLLSMQAGEGRLWRFSPVPRAAPLAGLSTGAAGPASADSASIRIDQQYDDWQEVPSLAMFSRIFEPASFTLERNREWQVLPLSASRFWKMGGTQLNEIKAVNSGRYLYFFISSQSVFSDEMSIFLYFHPDGGKAGSENRVTLEIAPRQGSLPGVVVLWEREDGPGELRPRPIGRLVSGNFFLEGRIDRRMLYQALGEGAGPDTFFDLTTSYFDRTAGIYEEYFFNSILLRDIPFLH